ncbi:MAG: hypothetical protein WB800_08035 [Streptosporangiaceae bacterium]
MAAGGHPADGASGAAFWSRFRDGWGLVRGTVRLTSGEPVEGCCVVYYAMGPPTDRIPDIGILTDVDGVYSYPLPAGTYTMAANGDVSRVGAAGGAVAVPVIGKVTGVMVSARQIVTAHITATERLDLIDKTADLAELLEIRVYGSTS